MSDDSADRFKMDPPLGGRFGSVGVAIREIGFGGCIVEHECALRVGGAGELRFSWQKQPLVFAVLVLHCRFAMQDGERRFTSELQFSTLDSFDYRELGRIIESLDAV